MVFLTGLAALLATNRVAAADAPLFERDILPILYHHCFPCHSQKQAQPKGDLLLDSAAGIRSGAGILPGQPEESELFKRVSLPHTDKEVMPPLKGGAPPLSESERATIREWIARGAPLDSWTRFDHRGPVARPVVRVPDGEDVQLLSREVQKLVDQHHSTKGTKMSQPAGDETFLRRVYLDVVGRIPSLKESEDFLGDQNPQKRSSLIARLCSSEGYVSHMFNWKADLLRVNGRGLAPGQPGKLYDDWVRDAVRSGIHWDEFVRRLITASGYIWENGAVGFYLRDLGMPLDHMSNLTRIFLGTRMECAQCHDHPLEPVTQKDFYQMAAFTFGVSNLGSPGGYSPDNVRHYPEIKAKLAALGKNEALEQGVSRTIAPLKRLTRDTDRELKFPPGYAYEAALRGETVPPKTLFGEEADLTEGDRRKAFAAWLTSPRNPRFAKNIVNRLWKRVMGAGLVEPVESFSVLPDGEHSQLLELLSELFVRLQFDERAFLSVLMNTPLYQCESVRESQEPGTAFELRGPLLRRLSAEQIWDSLLVLLAPDIDERKSQVRPEGVLDPERLRRLSAMSADELMEQARSDQLEHAKGRQASLRRGEQIKERAAAQARGDERELRRLTALHAAENAAPESAGPTSASGPGTGTADSHRESDPRWKSLPSGFVRASEIPLPLPLGHFLRQFGQSDRREIDAFSRDPNTTHSLALMNGELTSKALAEESFLRKQLTESNTSGAERIQLIFRAVLIRSAVPEELTQMAALMRDSPTLDQDVIWALMNSPEFLFNQ